MAAVPWLLVAVAVCAIGWMIWKRTRPSQRYVIGEQMAQAQVAEQARLSSPNVAPSPLPARPHYSLEDLELSDPPKCPLDDELSALCHRFARSSPADRSQLRESASMNDFYTLLSFSRRSAVFAMRD